MSAQRFLDGGGRKKRNYFLYRSWHVRRLKSIRSSWSAGGKWQYFSCPVMEFLLYSSPTKYLQFSFTGNESVAWNLFQKRIESLLGCTVENYKISFLMILQKRTRIQETVYSISVRKKHLQHNNKNLPVRVSQELTCTMWHAKRFSVCSGMPGWSGTEVSYKCYLNIQS